MCLHLQVTVLGQVGAELATVAQVDLAGLVQVEGLGGDLGQVVDGEAQEGDGLDGDLAVDILEELDKPSIWLLAGGGEGHHLMG